MTDLRPLSPVRLERFAEWGDRTLGIWILPPELLDVGWRRVAFACLEPAWRDNRPDVSCIPVGHYNLTPHECPNHGRTWRIVGGTVGSHPGAIRTNVEPHAGNLRRETKGCPLLGIEFGRLLGEIAVLRSGDAMGDLRAALPWGEGLELDVVNVGGLGVDQLVQGRV